MTSTTKTSLTGLPENHITHKAGKIMIPKQWNDAVGAFIHQQISRYERGVTSLNLNQLDQILRARSVSWESFILEVVRPFYPPLFDTVVMDMDVSASA